MTSARIPYFSARWFVNNTSSSTTCFSDTKVISKCKPVTLTVSCNIPVGGVCPGVSARGCPGCVCVCVCVSQGGWLGGVCIRACNGANTQTEWLTDRCKNITLPQTSFAGGKYMRVFFILTAWRDLQALKASVWFKKSSVAKYKQLLLLSFTHPSPELHPASTKIIQLPCDLFYRLENSDTKLFIKDNETAWNLINRSQQILNRISLYR